MRRPREPPAGTVVTVGDRYEPPRSPATARRRRRPATKHLPAVAAALTGIQVGASVVATRFVIDQTDPASLALLRYLIGLACLVPALLLRGPVRIARHDLAPIALLGIGQFGVLIALLNLGLRSIPAARGALLFATVPLLTMLLATALGQERLTGAKCIGVLLTIAGVGVALAGDEGRGERAIGRGDLAVLASAVVGAVCSVLYRPYLRRYPALPVSTIAMLAAVAFLTIPAAIEGFFGDARPRFDLGGWLIVLAIGLGSGAGYLLRSARRRRRSLARPRPQATATGAHPRLDPRD